MLVWGFPCRTHHGDISEGRPLKIWRANYIFVAVAVVTWKSNVCFLCWCHGVCYGMIQYLNKHLQECRFTMVYDVFVKSFIYTFSSAYNRNIYIYICTYMPVVEVNWLVMVADQLPKGVARNYEGITQEYLGTTAAHVYLSLQIREESSGIAGWFFLAGFKLGRNRMKSYTLMDFNISANVRQLHTIFIEFSKNGRNSCESCMPPTYNGGVWPFIKPIFAGVCCSASLSFPEVQV